MSDPGTTQLQSSRTCPSVCLSYSTTLLIALTPVHKHNAVWRLCKATQGFLLHRELRGGCRCEIWSHPQLSKKRWRCLPGKHSFPASVALYGFLSFVFAVYTQHADIVTLYRYQHSVPGKALLKLQEQKKRAVWLAVPQCGGSRFR